jgi:hypothetical protein
MIEPMGVPFSLVPVPRTVATIFGNYSKLYSYYYTCTGIRLHSKSPIQHRVD